ncbi:MAG TPA: nuclear transport factor 2 family protein [Pyrinomonadaceae bacterium]|nr:nuclear transport factor 2 family protein [Pyrinomonadaceae bacterium]
MKRHLAIYPWAAILVMAFASFCFAQPQATASPSPAAKPKPRMSKAALLKKLSANETALWTAWKNKDSKPFQNWLASDGVMIGEQGVGAKADVVQMMSQMPCEVKSFALSDWKLAMVDADAAVITYKGVADGTCAGQTIPTVWASSLWVNRKGRWMAFSHQETPVK